MPRDVPHRYNHMRIRGHFAQARARPRKGKQGKEDALFIPGLVQAEKLGDKRLRFYLCAEGPGGCAACRLCAYGREYLRRQAQDR